ncbi:alpha/beta-hydrolase [Schizopora paradoxa]|uniref:Alpha/beta-hydrolase n=1 Tax=Schizopora paradoxa TaxID=27342 RepID=A0A0H2S8A8_9AGAM|nr:alpha/beta-hydrolase [Schizopora paradoxa]
MLIRKCVGFRLKIVPESVSIKPSRTLRISSSRNSKRRIKIDVYEPPRKDGTSERKPLPVHVNFHASGFVLPVHGVNAEICVHWCRTVGCIVLDVDYAKAPFYPAPSALEDALDALEYVASRPDLYDISRVTLGGFSSGANIAILASLWTKAKLTVKGVIAWYPPTDLMRTGKPQMSGSFFNAIHRCLRQSYMPPGTDASDPRISPLFAPSELFPPLTLIVGSKDKLVVDSVELHKKLEADGVDCVLSIVPNAGHAWEWFNNPKHPLWKERVAALDLMERRMKLAMDL